MQITIQTEIWSKRIIVKYIMKCDYLGVEGVNTLGKSFLSSQEIPNCNFTHEYTNIILVSMDIKKGSPLQQLKTEGKVTLSSLVLSVSISKESSFSFNNSSTHSLFSLFLEMYSFFFLLPMKSPVQLSSGISGTSLHEQAT